MHYLFLLHCLNCHKVPFFFFRMGGRGQKEICEAAYSALTDLSVHAPMHCIFDGILGQYNFCWVEAWIIGATRKSLDLRNILSSRTSTCKTVQCSQRSCQSKKCVHFIYCSILKARMIRTHVKWIVFENIFNDSFPDDFGSYQWQLLRPLHSASHHAKILTDFSGVICLIILL